MTVPAIAAIETPPVEGAAEVEGLAVMLVCDGAAAEVDTAGGAEVEVGEEASKQLLSSVFPTILMSELPPWRPFASTIIKINDVERAAFTSHAKDVGPVGGFRVTVFPPGIIA